MTELILTTFDWVPKMPRGYVRDLRVRWALEEAGLPYRVESVPFRSRDAEHLAHQLFQVRLGSTEYAAFAALGFVVIHAVVRQGEHRLSGNLAGAGATQAQT